MPGFVCDRAYILPESNDWVPEHECVHTERVRTVRTSERPNIFSSDRRAPSQTEPNAVPRPPKKVLGRRSLRHMDSARLRCSPSSGNRNYD